jgi:hypothetical protein
MQALILKALLATGNFLLTVVPVFVIAVILAQLLVEMKWLNRFSWMARPIMRLGHLQPECGGSFIVTLLSPTAGHSMLKRFHDDKRIGRSELIIAAIVNTLPGYIAQGRTTLPVTIPLMGVFGVLYYVMVVLADLLKAGIALATGYFLLPSPDTKTFVPNTADSPQRQDFRTALRKSFPNSKKTIFRVLRTMVPVTFLVYLLLELGTFSYLATKMDAVTRYSPVKAELLPVVAARLATPVGAYTVAGNLLSTGVAGGIDVIMALLVGSLLATVSNMRYMIPYYFGIFGPKLGTQVIVISTALRIASFGLIIACLSLSFL